MNKPLIYDLSLNDISQTLAGWGEAEYRSRQIWSGLYQSLWEKPDDFTPLSKTLRNQLFENFSFSNLRPAKTIDSEDRTTQKILFRLPDNNPVEAVKMNYRNRRTLCISTQAGCAITMS